MSANESQAAGDDAKCRQHLDWINAETIIRKWNVTSKTIDRASRRLFPVTFLAFNIIYWLTYAVFTNDAN